MAKVEGATLDEAELRRALPQGLSGDDSAAFAELYVRRWIANRLKLAEAEELFSESAADIEAKVEAYRQSLLIRKLDHYYVDERVDTTFTEADITAYYNAHKAEAVQGDVGRTVAGSVGFLYEKRLRTEGIP